MTPLLPSTRAPVRNHRNGVRNRSESLAAFNRNSWPHSSESAINWRGKPLRSYRAIIQLIAATMTEMGLTVRAELDENSYPKGLRVSDDQLAAVNIFPHDFNGE